MRAWLAVLGSSLLAASCSGGDETQPPIGSVGNVSQPLGAATKIASFPKGAFLLGNYFQPRGYMNVGGRAVFMLQDALHGAEPWVTDGTAAGTQLLLDVFVGPSDSQPSNQSDDALTASLGDVGFFAATDGSWDQSYVADLFRTDGTANGTFRLPLGTKPGSVNSMVKAGNAVYVASRGLWKTDGTAAGTTQLGSFSANKVAAVGATVFASTQSAALYKSDGTSAGTVQIPGIAAQAYDLVGGTNTLYFLDYANNSLWKSDGATASQVAVLAGTLPQQPARVLYALGDMVLFSLFVGGHMEVWSGGAAGASLVMAFPAMTVQNTLRFYVSGAVAYFGADDGTHGFELWKTDGTPNGTSMVTDLYAGAGGGFNYYAIPFGAGLAFAGSTDNAGGAEQPYYTDGTAAGTVKLATPIVSAMLGVNGGSLYFMERDLNGASGTGTVWKSAGPGGTTTPVATPNAGTPGPVTNLVAMGSKVYFAADPDGQTPQLFASDGTPGGTAQITTKGKVWLVERVAVFGGKIYFAAQPAVAGGITQVYVSDGTPGDPTPITNFAQGLGPTPLVPSGAHLYFSGGGFLNVYDATNGLVALSGTDDPIHIAPFKGGVIFDVSTGARDGEWFTDGTQAGTIKVGGTVGLTPAAVMGGNAYYLSRYGLEKSDGTAGNGTELKTFASTTDVPPAIVATSSKVFFEASLTYGDPGVWVSDGTPGGTTRLGALKPAPSMALDGSPLPWKPATFGDAAVFAATDGTGPAWYVSDGTTTTKLAAATPGRCAPYAAGGKLFLCAADYAGEEIWTSDGTPAGTQFWFDLNPGAARSAPDNFLAVGASLYFTAYEGTIPGLYAADPTLPNPPRPGLDGGATDAGTSSSGGLDGSGGGGGSGGLGGAPDASAAGAAPGSSSGCGCKIARARRDTEAAFFAASAGALALLARRRRRSRR